MTPTPQKSTSSEWFRCIQHGGAVHRWVGSNGNTSEWFCPQCDSSNSERTAYNALLDKVQLIETERDELKKRVDSEYDRGIEDAKKVAEFHVKKEYLIKGKSDSWAQGNNTACYDIAEAILKLRRVS